MDVHDNPWVQRRATSMLLVHWKVRDVQYLLLEHLFPRFFLAFEHGGDCVDGIVHDPFAGWDVSVVDQGKLRRLAEFSKSRILSILSRPD